MHPDCENTSLIDQALLSVQKPCRYTGGEINAVYKDLSSVQLRMALAFPDAYEVGMSHLGLKILYSVLNARDDLYAERVFAPWPDREAGMREAGQPLTTLETHTPLSELDIVGFSLQYELAATSVLQMLDLGRIPLLSSDRTLGDPLIVAGGPVASNPAPLARFIDAFVIGEGEEVILELADCCLQWKNRGGTREELLQDLKTLDGVYVPALHRPGDLVARRRVANLDQAHFPTKFLVPFCEIVHDRVGIEIARGCTRGCRFCQAGMLYRPVRERNAGTVMDLIRKNISATGWEEVALLSLSTGDYSHIGPLIKRVTAEFAKDKVAVSLPSLRTETFEREMAEEIRKVRKTGFTLAPEAGTDRLRRVINKGNTEEDLERAITSAFEQGWTTVKLYFMVGLPTETDDDLEGIVRLVKKAAHWARRGKVTASVSTFVPKSHTPFQWAGQISLEETRRRQAHIRGHFRGGKVRVKFHDPRISFLEGVLARGDERLSPVIQQAFAKGARFDGWDEHLQFDLWMETFAECGVQPEDYLEPRSPDAPLPWDMIDVGVSRDYLLGEWEKARSETPTRDCRHGACSGCGVCNFKDVYTRIATEPGFSDDSTRSAPAAEEALRRFRLRYSKRGKAKFLGHQDIIRCFHRAFRRSGLRLDYSKGFHPHPKLRFSPPLAVGIESDAEYVDFDLLECLLSADAILGILKEALPRGIDPQELQEITFNEGPVSARIQELTFEVTHFDSLPADRVARKVREFHTSDSVALTRIVDGRTKTRNLKEWVTHLTFGGSALQMTLKSTASGSVHPLDTLSAILSLPRDHVRGMRMVKTSVRLTED